MSADVRRLARSTAVDVSVDGATNWLRVLGRTDTAPQVTPNKQDSSDYDSAGWTSFEITMQGWVLTMKYNKLSSGGSPDPTQELIRSCVGQFADAARLYVRWYDTDGGAEAYQGRAIVEYQRSKTAVADLAEVQVTCTGDGELTSIENPYAPAVAPVITNVTPSGIGTGGQVEIVGQNFTGTVASTGVKFGGTAATSFVVVSDSVIVAVLPSGSAGATTVTVTNATGPSAAVNYTRAA